jgi:hypothetical protein
MVVNFTDAAEVLVKVETWSIPRATRYLGAPITETTFITAIEQATEIILNDVINNGTPTEGHNPDT